jgi:hypothetical protein
MTRGSPTEMDLFVPPDSYLLRKKRQRVTVTSTYCLSSLLQRPPHISSVYRALRVAEAVK